MASVEKPWIKVPQKAAEDVAGVTHDADSSTLKQTKPKDRGVK